MTDLTDFLPLPARILQRPHEINTFGTRYNIEQALKINPQVQKNIMENYVANLEGIKRDIKLTAASKIVSIYWAILCIFRMLLFSHFTIQELQNSFILYSKHTKKLDQQ